MYSDNYQCANVQIVDTVIPIVLVQQHERMWVNQ